MATSHATSRLKVRLSSLTHAELLELATAGCAADIQLRIRADALIAQRTALPSWCVDIMLSPDMLLHVLGHATLGDKAAAAVCRVWAEAWTEMLRRRRHLRARLQRTLRPYHSNGSRVQPLAGHVMSDGRIIVGDFSRRGHNVQPMRLETLSPDGHVLHAGALRHWRFDFVHALLEHKGSLFVADREQVYKLRLSDGEEMGSNEDLSDLGGYNGGPVSLAIGGGDLFVGLGDHVCVLDPQTLEIRHTFRWDFRDADEDGDGESVTACAINGEDIYVGTCNGRPLGVLHVFDRTGLSHRHRTIRGEFGEVQALAFHNGRLFMVEIEPNEEDCIPEDCPGSDLFGRRLLVLSTDGAISQSIHLPDDVHDVRSMSIRGLYTRDGYVTEVYLYAIHGATVYVFELIDLSIQPARVRNPRRLIRPRLLKAP